MVPDRDLVTYLCVGVSGLQHEVQESAPTPAHLIEVWICADILSVPHYCLLKSKIEKGLETKVRSRSDKTLGE